jgi:hypothetical protein
MTTITHDAWEAAIFISEEGAKRAAAPILSSMPGTVVRTNFVIRRDRHRNILAKGYRAIIHPPASVPVYLAEPAA